MRGITAPGKRACSTVCATGVTRPATMLALACVAVSGCASVGSPAQTVAFSSEDWSFQGEPGTKLVSDHYILYTTCKSKPLLSALPGFLETCWQAYAELLPAGDGPDQPLEAYLFQKRWQWERFTEQFAPGRAETYKQIRSGGYSERGVTVSHYAGRRATLSVLAHEGLHQYLEATHDKPVPAWINEGLACYFEGFDLDGQNRPIFTPERNYHRRNDLRETLVSGSLLRLPDILGTHAGLEIHKRSRHVRAYYAQEWSLVVFLMRPSRTNPYHDGFRELLRELGSESMARKARAFLAADTDGTMSRGEAIFRAYVTDDLETFQADYEAYLYELLDLSR